MFVYNVKISSKRLFKMIIALMFIIVLIIIGLSIYKTFIKTSTISDDSDVYTIDSNNYTNILKAVHDDLDTYIGQKIHFTGYVYRVYDLDSDEFVLARDMVINSEFQTLVVGFLCHYEDSNIFKDGSWIDIVGEIKKGYYHGDIPIIDITEIKETEKPIDSYVYPPDDYYIPTSSLIYNNS